MMTDMLIAIWSRNKFVKIWNTIQDFDYETNKLGFPQTDKKIKVWVWVVLTINILNWLWINQTGMYAFSESFFQNFSYMFIYIQTCYSVLKFCGMVAIIGLRFEHLNEVARKCSLGETSWIGKTQVDQKVVRLFNLIHPAGSKKIEILSF